MPNGVGGSRETTCARIGVHRDDVDIVQCLAGAVQTPFNGLAREPGPVLDASKTPLPQQPPVVRRPVMRPQSRREGIQSRTIIRYFAC